MIRFRSVQVAILVIFAAVASCGSGSTADWSRLPEHLAGGIVVYGDSRTGHDEHRWLVQGMATIQPTAVFHTGDLVYDGNVEENWIIFNDIAAQLPSATPFYPALGNHENEAQLYFDNFELPGNERWYSLDIGNDHFIVLDTESGLAPGSTQYIWLENDLATAGSGAAHTLVFFHYPPYSTGYHPPDPKDLRSKVVPLLEQHGVDAVFNGHDHDYERSLVNGIRYVVTGGGGAPLRGQARSSPESELFVRAYHFCVLFYDQGSLTVEVWDSEVRLIDRFVIEDR